MKMKITLEFSPQVAKRLERIKGFTEQHDDAILFARALAYYQMLVEADIREAKIIIREPNGNEREIVIQ